MADRGREGSGRTGDNYSDLKNGINSQYCMTHQIISLLALVSVSHWYSRIAHPFLYSQAAAAHASELEAAVTSAQIEAEARVVKVHQLAEFEVGQ